MPPRPQGACQGVPPRLCMGGCYFLCFRNMYMYFVREIAVLHTAVPGPLARRIVKPKTAVGSLRV